MDSKIAELQSVITELESLKKQATKKPVIDILDLEIRKLETNLLKLREEKSAQSTSTPQTQSKQEQKRYLIKLNGYGWDQSEKFVKVFVTLKNVHTLAAENVHCNFTDDSMELIIKDLDNKDYTLVISKLLKPIKPDGSHWKQKTDAIVVFLAKVDIGTNWSHMTSIEKRFEENKASKFGNENMEGKDPQDSLMNLMRNMYEKGDDDMKRMINKAWTEGQEKRGTNTVDF